MAEKEYIERDSIYSRVKAHTNPYGKPTLDYESGVKVLDMIKREPAADVAPKSETAREILEEIEALATKHLALLEILSPQMSAVAAGGKHAFDLVLALTTELKKKYTEENYGT